jgi:hypothetical protein
MKAGRAWIRLRCLRETAVPRWASTTDVVLRFRRQITIAEGLDALAEMEFPVGHRGHPRCQAAALASERGNCSHSPEQENCKAAQNCKVPTPATAPRSCRQNSREDVPQSRHRNAHVDPVRAGVSSLIVLPSPPCKRLKSRPDETPSNRESGPCPLACPHRISAHQLSKHPSFVPYRSAVHWSAQEPIKTASSTRKPRSRSS